MTKRAMAGVMLSAALAVTAWTAVGPGAAGADESDVWNIVDVEDEAPQRRGGAEFVLDPSAFAALRLDQPALQARLAGGSTLDLPSPKGEMRSFTVADAEMMEPELAAKYPQIRAYEGEATDDSGDTIRFEVSPMGFRAQVMSDSGWWYVDPRAIGDNSFYLSYYKDDLRNPTEWIEDPAIAEYMAKADEYAQHNHDAAKAALRANGDQLRTYRLAVSADDTYTAFNGGTVAGALAAITTGVNRLNGIYRTELSVQFTLVADNDKLIFESDAGAQGPNGEGPNGDPFPATGFNNGGNLTVNQALIDSVIGDSGYDIGHNLAGYNCGLASGASVGVTGRKAQGCSGIPAPVLDPLHVDYFAHEVGHQFGANHTFNGCTSSSGNRVGNVAYEPGSATTILGYAGICGSDDVQKIGEATGAGGASDPYFHSASYDEMISYITAAGSPGNIGAAPNGNNIPTAEAGAGGAIPDATPFRLTGRSSDPDVGDTLTHRWEQRDLSLEAGLTSPPVANGPIFRSQPGTTSPTRFIPQLASIAAGTTNLDGYCGAPINVAARQCWAEFIPSVGRTLNFRMTVLDGAGGVNTDDMTVTVVDTATPFAVTAPNGGSSEVGGGGINVGWNPAGTTAAPISAANVNIRASLDGGLTYPFFLATNTPNDGSQGVILPEVAANVSARIMVESANQYCGVHFFDVSDADFTITPGGGSPTVAPDETQCTAPPNVVGAFESLSPQRFVDTRPAPAGDTLDGLFEGDGKRAADSQYRVTIAGRGNVPTDAQAVVMNITAIAPEGVGFFTVHPCVSPRPLASSLNYTPGVNLGNEIVAPLSATGDVCIYTEDSAHLSVDVTGFVDATSTTMPVTPRRFLDTRPTGQTFDGQSEGRGKLFSDDTVFLPVAGRDGVVPTNAEAVIVNVTAVAAERTGFVTVDPCAPTPPNASSLNYVAGTNRGNEIIAQLDNLGQICLFTSARVHLIADVVGYLPAGSPLSSVPPSRFLDTRSPFEGGDTIDGFSLGEGKQQAGSEYTLQIAGRGGVDANATSVVMNLTAVAANGPGFVTVHPCTNPRPNASSLNYVAGVNGGNEIVAQLSASGTVCLYTSNTTHLTADVVGFETT